MERVRIACCQFRADAGDAAANVDRMRHFAADAAGQGARVVLYPELAVTGYLAPERIAPLAQPLDGRAVRDLARAAGELRIGMVFGLAERSTEGCHNSLVFLDAQGAVAGVYRKIHLWDTERRWALPGTAPTVIDYQGFRVGGWICYDTRFPELARAEALGGAEVGLVATAWLGPGDEWELALRARALDNAMFVAGADTVDPAIGCRGRSMVVDPHGNVIARAPWDQDCIIIADLDPDVMARQRGRVPVLSDRRPEACTVPAG